MACRAWRGAAWRVAERRGARGEVLQSGPKPWGPACRLGHVAAICALWARPVHAQKVFDENTFVYQNEIREKVGVSALNWSNVCYEIAKVRAKETYNYFRKYGNKGIHDECDDTIKRILEKTYHVDYTKYGTIKYYNGKYDVEENNFTENWAEDTGRSGIDDLVNSPLHYATMISKDYKVGAISAYNSTNSMLFESTSAIYCKTDNLDIQIANDK